jgi:hypothetical protein
MLKKLWQGDPPIQEIAKEVLKQNIIPDGMISPSPDGDTDL